MAQVLQLSDPGNYKQALFRIKKLWNEGRTRLTFHTEKRMKERHVEIADIANVIRYGRIVGHNKPMTYWRYTLVGKALDGENMKCIVEINGILIIVTVI